jgi:hypothetical protein
LYYCVSERAWDFQREWLLGHGLIKSDYEKNRDALSREMKKYYYDVSDKVYNTWSDSDLKQWLVDHSIIKSDAQLQREKMVKLVSCVFTHFCALWIL